MSDPFANESQLMPEASRVSSGWVQEQHATEEKRRFFRQMAIADIRNLAFSLDVHIPSTCRSKASFVEFAVEHGFPVRSRPPPARTSERERRLPEKLVKYAVDWDDIVISKKEATQARKLQRLEDGLLAKISQGGDELASGLMLAATSRMVDEDTGVLSSRAGKGKKRGYAESEYDDSESSDGMLGRHNEYNEAVDGEYGDEGNMESLLAFSQRGSGGASKKGRPSIDLAGLKKMAGVQSPNDKKKPRKYVSKHNTMTEQRRREVEEFRKIKLLSKEGQVGVALEPPPASFNAAKAAADIFPTSTCGATLNFHAPLPPPPPPQSQSGVNLGSLSSSAAYDPLMPLLPTPYLGGPAVPSAASSSFSSSSSSAAAAGAGAGAGAGTDDANSCALAQSLIPTAPGKSAARAAAAKAAAAKACRDDDDDDDDDDGPGPKRGGGAPRQRRISFPLQGAIVKIKAGKYAMYHGRVMCLNKREAATGYHVQIIGTKVKTTLVESGFDVIQDAEQGTAGLRGHKADHTRKGTYVRVIRGDYEGCLAIELSRNIDTGHVRLKVAPFQIENEDKTFTNTYHRIRCKTDRFRPATEEEIKVYLAAAQRRKIDWTTAVNLQTEELIKKAVMGEQVAGVVLITDSTKGIPGAKALDTLGISQESAAAHTARGGVPLPIGAAAGAGSYSTSVSAAIDTGSHLIDPTMSFAAAAAAAAAGPTSLGAPSEMSVAGAAAAGDSSSQAFAAGEVGLAASASAPHVVGVAGVAGAAGAHVPTAIELPPASKGVSKAKLYKHPMNSAALEMERLAAVSALLGAPSEVDAGNPNTSIAKIILANSARCIEDREQSGNKRKQGPWSATNIHRHSALSAKAVAAAAAAAAPLSVAPLMSSPDHAHADAGTGVGVGPGAAVRVGSGVGAAAPSSSSSSATCEPQPVPLPLAPTIASVVSLGGAAPVGTLAGTHSASAAEEFATLGGAATLGTIPLFYPGIDDDDVILDHGL